MKRIYLLLMVIAVMTFGAVNASACVECRHIFLCKVVPGDAYVYCTFDSEGCCLDHDFCPGLVAQTSLASQYTVASVERLDQGRVVIAANRTKTVRASSTVSQNR